MKVTSRKRILVVDDDPLIRRMLSGVLASEGYGVVAAANGVEAVDSANTTPPDLVLLDLSLREKSGWDVFQFVKKIKPLVPVVIVSGKANQLFTALAAGAGALLEKPLQMPKLLETVRHLLAEPVEVRLARLAGKFTDFQYLPA